ncbi:MAG: PHB depolymerase family esterase [Spirochaetota bacterium]
MLRIVILFASAAFLFGAGLEKRTIRVGAMTREYLIYLPSVYNGEKPLAVVIMLHGGGGTGEAARIETGWDKKAEREGFIAVFPEGSRPHPGKPAKFAGNPQGWNDGSGRFYAGENNIDDVSFIGTLIDELVRIFAADINRIYITGFSNGSSLTYRLGIELAEKIAAVAPVASSGLRVNTAPRTKAPPLISIQGLADPRNPPDGGAIAHHDFGLPADPRPPIIDSIRRYAAHAGCGAEAKTIVNTNGVTAIRFTGGGSQEVVSYTIDDMGHTWPGGRSLLPSSVVGAMTKKMNATDVLWDFFMLHAR